MAVWDPFEDVDNLRRQIDRAFQDYGFRTEPFFGAAFLPGRGPRGYPLVNVSEDANNVYVEAMAPGIDPSSLNLIVVHNTVTLSGEKKGVGEKVESEAFHREERASGRFVRNFALPVEIDESKVNAEYKNGLLLITLPKAEKAKPKRISVQVS